MVPADIMGEVLMFALDNGLAVGFQTVLERVLRKVGRKS